MQSENQYTQVAYSRYIKQDSDKSVATESSLAAVVNTSVSGNLSPNKILESDLFLNASDSSMSGAC